jgi:hypothetical protein
VCTALLRSFRLDRLEDFGWICVAGSYAIQGVSQTQHRVTSEYIHDKPVVEALAMTLLNLGRLDRPICEGVTEARSLLDLNFCDFNKAVGSGRATWIRVSRNPITMRYSGLSSANLTMSE